MASRGEEKVYSAEPDGTIRLLHPFKSLYSVFKPGVSFREDTSKTYNPPTKPVVHFSAKRSTHITTKNFFEFKRTDGIPSSGDCIINEGIALNMHRHQVGLLPSFELELKLTAPGQVRIYSRREKLELSVDLCCNITVYNLCAGVHKLRVPDLGIFYVYSENANITGLRVTALPPACQLVAKPIVVLTTRERDYEVAWTVKTILGGYLVGTYSYVPTPEWEEVAKAIVRTFKYYECGVPIETSQCLSRSPTASEIAGQEVLTAILWVGGPLPSDVGMTNLIIGTAKNGDLKPVNNDAIGYLYIADPERPSADRHGVATFFEKINHIGRDLVVPEARLLDREGEIARGVVLGMASITPTSYSYNVSAPPNGATCINPIWNITYVDMGGPASNYAVTPYRRDGTYGFTTYNSNDIPITYRAGILDVGSSPENLCLVISNQPVTDVMLGWISTNIDGKSSGTAFGGLWTCSINYQNTGNIGSPDYAVTQ